MKIILRNWSVVSEYSSAEEIRKRLTHFKFQSLGVLGFWGFGVLGFWGDRKSGNWDHMEDIFGLKTGREIIYPEDPINID